MRTFLIAFIVILIGIVGYAYSKDPRGCLKVAHDFGVLFNSLSSVKVEIKNGLPIIASTENSTNATPEAASAAATPTPLPLPANSLIQNGDFSQGDAHWEGDGVTPRAYAARNPSAFRDSLGNGVNSRLLTKGFIVIALDTTPGHSFGAGWPAPGPVQDCRSEKGQELPSLPSLAAN